MINIETLLSSFDERGTLLKWLKAVEKALNEATLTSVDVITISTQQIQLQFNFEDGTHLTTPTITLPKGDKGDKGDTGETGASGQNGVSVSNVTVNASNHLIVTLTDETEIDAGEINVTSSVAIDTTMSASSENPVQNKVIYTALVGKQDALTTSSINDGTIDKSIGFDSQGNIVKESAGGGGGLQLYKHLIQDRNTPPRFEEIYIISKRQAPYVNFSDIISDDTIVSVVRSGEFPTYRYNCMFCCDTGGLKVYYYDMESGLDSVLITTIFDIVIPF